MRFFAAAATITMLLMVPAYAQQGAGKPPHPDDVKAKQRADEADRGYRNMLEATKGRNTDGKIDPWANIRQPAEAAPPAKNKKSN